MRSIDDDMDDLFRRAADNYPLNTNSSDWNKVNDALQSPAPVEKVKEKKKYRRFLWLLLLLPGAFVLDKYAFQNHDTANIIIKNQLTSPETSETSPKKTDAQSFNDNKATPPVSLNKKDLSSPTSIIENKIIDKANDRYKKRSDPYSQYSSKQNVTAANEVSIKSKIDEVKKDVTTDAAKEDVAMENKGSDPASVNENFKTGNQNKNPTTINENIGATENNNQKTMSVKEDIRAEPTDETEIKKVEDKTTVVNDTLQSNKGAKVHKQIAVKKRRPQSFYVGIVAGPDFSTVKLEKIIKTGYTVGIIAGYRFNKNLSIESGLLIDKKYYFSEGKYFNPMHLYAPYNAKIVNVDGNCHMTEFPLNVKYDFKSNRKSNWFAVAGISSYFMSKEDYKYRYQSNGWQGEKSVSVNDASQIWASVMNLSLGYNRNIRNLGALRLEPYVKIPFRNIGIGNLPVTSVGVYLVFTKNLF